MLFNRHAVFLRENWRNILVISSWNVRGINNVRYQGSWNIGITFRARIYYTNSNTDYQTLGLKGNKSISLAPISRLKHMKHVYFITTFYFKVRCYLLFGRRLKRSLPNNFETPTHPFQPIPVMRKLRPRACVYESLHFRTELPLIRLCIYINGWERAKVRPPSQKHYNIFH